MMLILVASGLVLLECFTESFRCNVSKNSEVSLIFYYINYVFIRAYNYVYEIESYK